MDPVTQGLIGAALPLCFARREEVGKAALMGAASGMAPDLDVLIRSSVDPLLFIQYHRHFTHALVFVPIGALIVWLVLSKLAARRFFADVEGRRLYLFAFLGYLTHAPLDCCTSYGTHWLWPFTNARIAWNNVAVVDPLYTLPLGIFVVFAIWKKRAMLARVGMIVGTAYLLLGVIQRERAEGVITALAKSRRHEPVRLEAKPSLGNLVLWRGIYEADGRFWVDAARVGIFSSNAIYEGGSVATFEPERDVPDFDPNSRMARDIGRFTHFSDGYVAVHPEKPGVVGDIRYALLPQSLEPLWGIWVDPEKQDNHTPFENFRDVTDEKKEKLLQMLKGAELNR